MKLALAVAVVVIAAVCNVHAQDYYYGSDPAPSMYAAQVGQMQAAPFVNENGQPIPAAPTMDAIMAGNQQMMPPQYMAGQQMMPTAFVEQPQFAAAAAPYFATHESEVEESDEEAESADESEEADTESDSEEETESDEAEDSEARFMEQTGPSKKEKKAAKKAGKGTKSGKKTHKLSSKKTRQKARKEISAR